MCKLIAELRSTDRRFREILTTCRHRLSALTNTHVDCRQGVRVFQPRNEFDVDYRGICQGLERFVRSGKGRSIVVGLGKLSSYGTNAVYLPVDGVELGESLDSLHDSLRQEGIVVGALECALPAVMLAEDLTRESYAFIWETYSSERFPSEVELDLLSVRTDTGRDLYTLQLQP